jgi:hypothetical protein
MPHVPDEAVLRGVEDVVERNRELDDSKSGAEMSSRDGDGVDRLLAQLVGELAQLARLEAPQVGGRADEVKKRGLGGLGQRMAPPTIETLT